MIREYTKLGKTGLEVSRLCLGCMSFVAREKPGPNGAWEKGEAERSSRISPGEMMWSWPLKSTVQCTRSRTRMGLSRKSILTEVDNFLQRLGTDYIDLYLIHRWAPNTTIKDTFEALHDIKKAGKVRYLDSSRKPSTQRSATDGRGSPRCRTTTT